MTYKKVLLQDKLLGLGSGAYLEKAKSLGIPASVAIPMILNASVASDPLHIMGCKGPSTPKAEPPKKPSGPTEEQRAMQRAMRAKYEAEQAEKNKTKETP